jgi:hypothetical protein
MAKMAGIAIASKKHFFDMSSLSKRGIGWIGSIALADTY